MSRVAVHAVVVIVLMLLASSVFAQNVSVTVNTIPSGGWCNFYSPPGNYAASTPPITFPSGGSTVAGSIETSCYSSGGVLQSDDVISFNESAATITVNSLPPPSGGWANFYVNGTYEASTPPVIVSGSQPLEVKYINSSNQVVVDETYTWDSTVIMSSPAKAATVSGPVNIVTQYASNVSWENIYVDGNYLASSAPLLFSWDSILAANGSHTISSSAYNSSGTQVGSTNVNVSVSNSGSPNAVYVSSSTGNDNNSGTQAAPWKTIAKVISAESSLSPGEHVLFKGGDIWNEELTLNNVNGSSGNPIVFASYGSGRPIIDGNGSLVSCISADQSQPNQGAVSYLTVAGFECRNTTQYGINFMVENNGTPTPMPGVVIENNYIHDTGPSSSTTYYNQLNAEDDSGGQSGGDGFQIINNVVKNCGGWNCLEVHYDIGGPVVQGNIVGPGCKFHNCIDVKGVVNGKVTGNTVTCPDCTGDNAGFYIENTNTANADVTWEDNLAYDIPIGFQIETGGTCNLSSCATTAGLYNNTVYNATLYDVEATSCGQSGSPITLDVQKNIFDIGTDTGTVDIHSGCTVTWNYNDDVGSINNPSGSNNISVDPQFLNPSSGYFTPQSWAVLNAGESDNVTSYTFLGGLP